MNDPIIRNYEEITLGSDVFQGIRENFDLLLQRLFRKMEQVKSDEGSITLKIDVTIQKDQVPDENGVNLEVNKPVIKHKITTAVPVKDSFDGKKETGMDLVYDDDLKRYVLRYVNVGGQRSLFDPDFVQKMNQAEPTETQEVVYGEVKALPGPGKFLPTPDEMDVDQGETDNGQEEAMEGDSGVINVPDEENPADDFMTPPQGFTEAEEDDDYYDYDEPEEE